MKNYIHICSHALLGGTEKDCLYIIRATKDAEHTVLVLGRSGPMVEQWEREGAKVHVLECLDCNASTFVHIIRNNIYDCTGVMYWSTIKLPLVRRALKHLKCKLAVHVGNPLALSILSRMKMSVTDWLYPSSIQTAFFSCSEYVRHTLSAFSYYQKFEHYVSLNPVTIPETRCYSSRQLSSDSAIIIGMTARLDPIKDHKKVLHAFKLISAKIDNAQLWLIGDGVLREQLENEAEQLGIKEKVVFWGQVDDVYKLLAQLDVFIYATTKSEGLGNAVSEALASGIPSVVSDLPMMHEIGGEDNALIYAGSAEEFAESVISMIHNEAGRNNLSKKAFSRAKAVFSSERYLSDRESYLLR